MKTIQFNEIGKDRAHAQFNLWSLLPFFYFLHMYYQWYSDYIYVEKIHHRDCSETGAISEYVSDVAFFYEIYK